MKLFAKVINGSWPFNIFAKSFILGFCQGSEYVSAQNFLLLIESLDGVSHYSWFLIPRFLVLMESVDEINSLKVH